MNTCVAVSWTGREPPLPAVAVTSRAEDLADLLSATVRQVQAGYALRVVLGQGGGVVLGATDELPWCEGAVYLGWECGVLVPTTRRLSLPMEFLASVCRGRLPAGHDLVVLLPWALLAAPMPGDVVDLAVLEACRDAAGGRDGAVGGNGNGSDGEAVVGLGDDGWADAGAVSR